MKKRLFGLVTICLLLSFCICFGVACNSNKNTEPTTTTAETEAPATEAPTTETNTETQTEAPTTAPESDTVADTSSESTSEEASEAESESAPESTSEKVSETEAESTTETETVSETTTEVETTTEAESESEVETTTEVESESEVETTTEAESESEVETTTEAESESEVETTTEAESESEVETTTEAESESEVETTTEAESESDTEVTPDTETESESESETETETETEEVTTEEVTTEVDNTDRINILKDPTKVTFYGSKVITFKDVITDRNNCVAAITKDKEYGTVLRLTTNANSSDPFVMFRYENYVKAHNLTPVSADEYKYVVLTVKAENCTCETFELFYCAGNITGPTAGYMTTGAFNSTLDGWQKIVFDLSNVDFSGTVHAFRLDFLSAPGSGKETIYIAGMDFYKTREEAFGDIDIDLSRPGEGVEYTEHKFAGVNYNAVTAPNEDENLLLWFDHMTEKVPRHVVEPTNRKTYVISMAGNSIENCQVFLAPTAADANVNVSISNFTNGSSVLRTELLRENYLNINGVYYPDALPKVNGSVSIKKNNSQGFVIKVWADANQPAGLYSATFTVTDANTGNVIKQANVYVNVLDFSLPEETTLKSAIGLSKWNIGVSYQNNGLSANFDDLYKTYYDFLLENRLCAYQLPYDLYDSRAIAYLNNPRVNSFVINKSVSNGEDMTSPYNYLKDNASWMDKGMFYYVDEPCESEKLNLIAAYGNRLEANFPGYQQISPFFTNVDYNGVDQVEFMSPYINIWCTKMFAFTPRDKYMVSGVQYMTSRIQDERYGTFAERVEEFKAQGEKLWLYICWEPEQPYTNWLIMGDGTETIVSIWQCMMLDAEGILYWDASYWNSSDPFNNMPPLIGATAHGDGVLLYSGALVGSYEPVSSMRLESIRQGMQDHMMLSMLDDVMCDKFVAKVTEDVITYTNDDDYLNYVRQNLGLYIEAHN